jgi:hypothetical protein
VTPKTEALAETIFGPMAEEGYRVMAAYSDAELELISGFIRASRELLKRHLTRIYDLIEQGREPSD